MEGRTCFRRNAPRSVSASPRQTDTASRRIGSVGPMSARPLQKSEKNPTPEATMRARAINDVECQLTCILTRTGTKGGQWLNVGSRCRLSVFGLHFPEIAPYGKMECTIGWRMSSAMSPPYSPLTGVRLRGEPAVLRRLPRRRAGDRVRSPDIR